MQKMYSSTTGIDTGINCTISAVVMNNSAEMKNIVQNCLITSGEWHYEMKTPRIEEQN